MNLGAFLLIGLPAVLCHTPALEQERGIGSLCPFSEIFDLWSRKEPNWSQTKESMEKTELIFWGIKKAEPKLTNGYSLGCLRAASILKSLAFSFSQDSRHGGILGDLGKQGEVLGNQALKAVPRKGQSWHSFPPQCSGVKPELFSLAV